jgi:hypothetical protein
MRVESGSFVRDEHSGPGPLHVVVEGELADHRDAVDLVRDVFNMHDVSLSNLRRRSWGARLAR